ASGAAEAIITFVSDLLLTLIIMEVLGTVVNYLETHATSLKPFLFIGIISATRGILAVGARLSVSTFEQLNPAEFRDSMIELGINAAVIIALGVTLKLIGNFLDEDVDDGAAPSSAEAGAEGVASPTDALARQVDTPIERSTNDAVMPVAPSET
ncbi:MAG: phosphate-starvation-inducible PsiE family protein, partial [Ktedonobacterales bacterium]